MANAAAASTSRAAAHAASQALLSSSNDPTGSNRVPGTAIDAVIAGVLAIATRRSGALLGAGAFLIGGTGEGLVVVDGRARQPGSAAPRPRGFVRDEEIPEAARVSVPLLPMAIAVAHAGRGALTIDELARIGVGSAQIEGSVDGARAEAIRAFGRQGALFLRSAAFRTPLLATAPRSRGGLLTSEDLDAARPVLSDAATVRIDGRAWALPPWAQRTLDVLAGRSADTTVPEPAGDPVVDVVGEIAIVAASDIHGGLAIAALAIDDTGAAVGDSGLTAGRFARPVRRGRTRVAPLAALPFCASIAIARAPDRASRADLAIGLGGASDGDELFPSLLRGLSVGEMIIDDVIAKARGPGWTFVVWRAIA